MDLKRDITLQTKLKDAFIFFNLEPDSMLDEKSYQRDKSTLEEAAAAATDVVMFGEADKAIVAVEQFVKLCN